MTEYRKKLIEVALPLEAINAASAREKSIRHGHPSTLHLWWARRPLAACRAVLFGQFVDDPSSWPELYPTEAAQDKERQRLFRIIEELVKWENSNNEVVINAARLEIARSVARNRRADGEGNERDDQVLAKDVEPAVVNKYLAEVAPPVHDPFAGGGSIPLEAQRLGLRAIATDLNPVAVLINKALIEIPPKFAGMPPVNPESRRKAGMRTWKGAEGLAEDVRYYGKWMRDEAFKRIGHLYPPVKVTKEMAKGRTDLEPYVGKELTVIAWLWARTVASPNPAVAGVHIPLVSSFWLSRKKGKESWVEVVVAPDRRSWRFKVRHGTPADQSALESGTRTGKAQDFYCALTNTPVTREYIQAEGKAGRLGLRLMAIAALGNQSRVYLTPDPDAEAVAACAESASVAADARAGFLSGSLPNRAMITGGVCSAYGLASWGQLFTDRQLHALVTLADLVVAANATIANDARDANADDVAAYSDAVSLYLGLGLSRQTNYSATLCAWSSHPKDELPKQVFMRQALPMTWDFAETNLFSSAGGNLLKIQEYVARSLEVLPAMGAATVRQADAAKAEGSEAAARVAIATDPPYYDNIGYAELSDYFYVWLRRALHPLMPSSFATMLTPKQQELVVTPFRFGGSRKRAEEFFSDGLKEAFRSFAASQHRWAALTLFYAFKQTETAAAEDGAVAVSSTGWESMLTGLVESGLQVVGTWPVRTELTAALKKSVSALASSVVLVCRHRARDADAVTRSDFRRLLRQELPKALKSLQKGNVAPVDLAQASIGPGMAIFSRHAKVIEADGSAMTVRTALQLINEALDEYLAEQTGEFGPDTRFAVTWFESHGFDSGKYGDAETLAKARNVSVQGVVESGILHSAAGKVRLLKRSELPDDWEPETDDRLTVWECTQHLIKRLEGKGEAVAADLLSRLGDKADPARDLAYRLYQTCERKGWAEEARAYNGLVVAWPELAKLAAQQKSTGPAQTSLFE